MLNNTKEVNRAAIATIIATALVGDKRWADISTVLSPSTRNAITSQKDVGYYHEFRTLLDELASNINLDGLQQEQKNLVKLAQMSYDYDGHYYYRLTEQFDELKEPTHELSCSDVIDFPAFSEADEQNRQDFVKLVRKTIITLIDENTKHAQNASDDAGRVARAFEMFKQCQDEPSRIALRKSLNQAVLDKTALSSSLIDEMFDIILFVYYKEYCHKTNVPNIFCIYGAYVTANTEQKLNAIHHVLSDTYKGLALGADACTKVVKWLNYNLNTLTADELDEQDFKINDILKRITTERDGYNYKNIDVRVAIALTPEARWLVI